MREKDPSLNSFFQLVDRVDLVIGGVDYTLQGNPPRKIRKITWSPSGDQRQTYILRDEDWSDFGIPEMPTRVLSLSMSTVQRDLIVDTHRVTIDIFGELGHQIDSETHFRIAGNPLFEVSDEDEDDFVKDMEQRKLATDHEAEINLVLDALVTYDPMFAWEDPQSE